MSYASELSSSATPRTTLSLPRGAADCAAPEGIAHTGTDPQGDVRPAAPGGSGRPVTPGRPEPPAEEARVNPIRFLGKRFDSGSGSYDMGARRYSAQTGRWLQQDFYYDALDNLDLSMDPLTANRYAFLGANPVNYVEFDGHTFTVSGGGGNPHGCHKVRGKKVCYYNSLEGVEEDDFFFDAALCVVGGAGIGRAISKSGLKKLGRPTATRIGKLFATKTTTVIEKNGLKVVVGDSGATVFLRQGKNWLEVSTHAARRLTKRHISLESAIKTSSENLSGIFMTVFGRQDSMIRKADSSLEPKPARYSPR